MYTICMHKFSIQQSGFLNFWESVDLKSGIEINGEPCGEKNKTGSIPHIIYQEEFQMD